MQQYLSSGFSWFITIKEQKSCETYEGNFVLEKTYEV